MHRLQRTRIAAAVMSRCAERAAGGWAEICALARVRHVQAEKKREKKQARRIQGKEEKERKRSDGRQPRDTAKRGAAAVVVDAVLDDTVDDAEALEEERRTLDMLLVQPRLP